MMKGKVIFGGATTAVLVTLLLWLTWPIVSIRIGWRYDTSGLQNPLYFAVFGGMSADRFASLVASNRTWINKVQRLHGAADDASLLSVCADMGLTNHVKILIQNGADVPSSIAYFLKYGGTNEAAFIRYCQESADSGK